ncbi:hypothetical protein AOLI_G00094580 [Acnodon oligacanthus]
MRAGIVSSPQHWHKTATLFGPKLERTTDPLPHFHAGHWGDSRGKAGSALGRGRQLIYGQHSAPGCHSASTLLHFMDKQNCSMLMSEAIAGRLDRQRLT